MQYATLKPKKEVPVLAGHPWVFSDAVDVMPESETGDIVGLKASDGRVLGVGTWNARNSIRLRLCSRDPAEKIDVEYFRKRFEKLDTWKRPRLPENTTGYRVVHAEADGIPGLIMDRYADTIVFQLHTAGMDRLRMQIVEAAKLVFSPKAIVERSDVEVRKLEGLSDQPISIHLGEVTQPIIFQETGLSFEADVMRGQKTGFFLDQREARRIIGRLSRGKRVLNLFSYSGAFSIHAAMGGASAVTSVDASHAALESAERQFRLNKLNPDDETKYRFLDADIFEMTQEDKPPAGPYDLIICDPPALAKTAHHVPNALKSYTSLNAACLKWLRPGGVLLTSSCSGRLTTEDFRSMLRLAAGRARKDVRLVDWLPQPVDHAERLAFPEGRYLKTAVLEVEADL